MISRSEIKKTLKFKYTRSEAIKIVDIGPADFAGYANCRLEDGTTRIIRKPVRGEVAKIKYYIPEILEAKDHEGFIIKEENGEEFFLDFNRALMIFHGMKI